ncbi:sigma-70 family RNA polymerase sigma factor [Klebsiella sp. 2680]|uniref:sigma-70 family RNA polymerase sigma factor n=1 Tax=Klebsiella sp. 2680 TaxID=2018037 RepID=UPI00115BB29A|nr:sigma-70 family RNA polymerase sigma factor [Klebsiella sp. 2680]
MKTLNISPQQLKSVSGKMIAWRAAETLGLNITQFYYLSRKYSVSTAFVSRRWNDKDISKAIELKKNGLSHRDIGIAVGRSEGAIKTLFRNMRRGRYKSRFGAISND